MKAFDLKATWPKAVRQDDAVAATFAALCIAVGGEAATTYVDLDDGSESDFVDQPMLYLAEWLVENWWPLLWEPEKFDDIERKPDLTFLTRHSLRSAGHGFALPDVRFIPVGDDVRISAKPYVADHARVRFTKDCGALLSRMALESVLRNFIDAICARLPAEATVTADWALIRETTDEAAQFCRLKGALGLSPYVTHARIETALDKVSEVLTEQQLLDLCQTATVDDFIRSARVAGLVSGILDKDASKVDLGPLSKLPMPSDIHSSPAYKRGYAAAKALRSELGIDEEDIGGGARVFNDLEIDWSSGSRIDLKGFSSPVSGALDRTGAIGRLALVHEASSSRRFAAARATYFFWKSDGDERRLLTNAATRDQQASRAFAAELLVPQSLVRSRARRARISVDQVDAIAEEAMVSPEVVRHQATNSGLAIAA